MSEASRSTALAHAIAVHKDGDADTVLATAERFHAYMTDASPAEPKPAKVAAPKVAKGAPKAATKPAPIEDDDAPEVEETGDEVTKEQVGEAIEAMLNANLRNEAIALFKKYKATSLSSLQPANYAAVKQAAEDAVLAA